MPITIGTVTVYFLVVVVGIIKAKLAADNSLKLFSLQ